SPDEYCLVWITSDLVSIAIVIGIFIFQKPSRDVNIMKEKLIFSEVSNGVTTTDEHLYPENGYDIGQY
ncbi:unnamed protein product, partial [Coregonus sp. 'balchen']